MNRNNNFFAVKMHENVRDHACRKSVTAGLDMGALLSQICNCRAQRQSRHWSVTVNCNNIFNAAFVVNLKFPPGIGTCNHNIKLPVSSA